MEEMRNRYQEPAKVRVDWYGLILLAAVASCVAAWLEVIGWVFDLTGFQKVGCLAWFAGACFLGFVAFVLHTLTDSRAR